jgi:hypothetical protein
MERRSGDARAHWPVTVAAYTDRMSRTEDSYVYVLVIRLWLHDGVPVARLLALPSTDSPPEESTIVAGTDRILATIERWMTDRVSKADKGDPGTA